MHVKQVRCQYPVIDLVLLVAGNSNSVAVSCYVHPVEYARTHVPVREFVGTQNETRFLRALTGLLPGNCSRNFLVPAGTIPGTATSTGSAVHT